MARKILIPHADVRKRQEDATARKKIPEEFRQAKSDRKFSSILSIIGTVLTIAVIVSAILLGRVSLGIIYAASIGAITLGQGIKAISSHRKIKEILRQYPELKNMSKQELLKEIERINNLYEQWFNRPFEEHKIGFEEWMEKHSAEITAAEAQEEVVLEQNPETTEELDTTIIDNTTKADYNTKNDDGMEL